HVELLHAQADPEDGDFAVEDAGQQVAVGVLAAGRHRVDGGGQALAVAPRVHVRPAGEDDPGEPVEDRVEVGEVVPPQRREQDGQPAGGDDRVEVPGVEAGVRGRVAGRDVVGVHADERAARRRGGGLVLAVLGAGGGHAGGPSVDFV